MEQVSGIHVLEEEPIQGPAAFVEEHEGAVTTDEELATELRTHALEGGIALPGDRGAIDEFRRIVDRLRGRRLLEDLGEHEFTIDWLTFHVPPGGTGRLAMTNGEGASFGVRIGVVGLGHGSGRRISLSTSCDFRDRDHCLRLSETVRGRVLAYADAGEETPSHLQVDVLEHLTTVTTELDPCPECDGGLDEAGFLYGQSDPAIDLRGDSVGQTRETTYTFESDAEAELGIPLVLPGIELTPAVAVSRSVNLRCDTRYAFPGGYCYTPYTEIGSWEDFPFWRRT